MSDFESLVRPFQRREVSLPVRLFDATQKIATDVALELGKDGQVKTFNESFAENVTTFVETTAKEVHRETSKKRIENPDDSSQFVEVELIKKLTTEQGEGKDYKKITTTLNNKG